MKPEERCQTFNISEFKAKILRLVDETAKKGKEYILTKKGVPIARVVPLKSIPATRRGSLKGLVEIQGDIVHLDSHAEWEVLK